MAIPVNQPIVGCAVVKPDESAPSAPWGEPTLPERPEVLLGATYKIKTPLSDHALYITINNIEEGGTVRPFEIFINSREMAHFQWIVAMTRIMSALFRKGGDLAFLVDEMRSVFDPNGGYFKKGGQYIPSLVAEIGDVIEHHLHGLGLIQRDDSLAKAARAMLAEKQAAPSTAPAAMPPAPQRPTCPKCQQPALVMMDGCMTCTNCGDSKCG